MDLGSLEMPAKKVLAECTITVHVVPVPSWRILLASWCFRLGGWVIGFGKTTIEVRD